MSKKVKDPLTIWIDASFEHHPAMRELAGKHRVFNMLVGDQLPPTPTPDLILSPVAHMFTDDMWEMLPVVIKAAEKRRKAKDG